jgi:hypothetical protein
MNTNPLPSAGPRWLLESHTLDAPAVSSLHSREVFYTRQPWHKPSTSFVKTFF